MAANLLGSPARAAIWSRVSSDEQECENQVLQLRAFAERRNLEIVSIYRVEQSGFRGEHRHALDRVMAEARSRRFSVLLVWSLDRLSREGPLATLQLMDRFARLDVHVVSLQEPWTEVGSELRDLLLALVGWVARYESQRRSERTRAGLQRAVAEGKRLGRPPGSKDRRRRRRSGYFRRYADQIKVRSERGSVRS